MNGIRKKVTYIDMLYRVFHAQGVVGEPDSAHITTAYINANATRLTKPRMIDYRLQLLLPVIHERRQIDNLQFKTTIVSVTTDLVTVKFSLILWQLFTHYLPFKSGVFMRM